MTVTGRQIELYITNTLKPKAVRYCGPLIFTKSLNDVCGVDNNGSFSLIDTGVKKLLVTNHHVVEGFRNAKREHGNMWMCISIREPGFSVLDESWLIDSDGDTDLATFDITPLLNGEITKEFYSIPSASIASAEMGDRLLFLGFPGRSRRLSEGSVISGVEPCVIVANACSPKQIVSDISQLRYVDENGNLAPVPDAEHGGASGTPCFLILAGGQIQLAGFVKEGLSYLISIACASLIRADGTIDRSFNEVRA
jgi:hypothetical protein